MTEDISNRAGTNGARVLLMHSEQALEDVLAAFALLAKRIKDGDLPSDTDFAQSCRVLARTRITLIEEIQKHEKRVLVAKGNAAEAPLDFDAIKDEIGRKLDRLREQKGSGGASK
ncbi:MAG: hypothetical protein GKR98_05595 [Boseongicola sp.]|nr:MAG: hypothetical protein GKR98_05595 [Boseongicola sp.]